MLITRPTHADRLQELLAAPLTLFLVFLSIITTRLDVVHAAPIVAPDLSKCQPATASSIIGAPLTLTFNCCLPLPQRQILDFSFHKYPAVPRVRRAAHKAPPEYIKKYNRAYQLMKSLPPSDPRSFAKQADIHCAFCNGAYAQSAASNVTLQVHFSWLFLPWHRWYLYFHERILASLIGDPDFSLLFWNWDNQEDGNVLPSFFVNNESALYDSKRNQNHLPPSLVRLNALSNTTNTSEIIQENLNQMYQSVVTASTAQLFLGGAYRLGTDNANETVLDAPLGGSLEDGVHNAIHFWTGDPLQPLIEDMGVFTTAARDPIFYAHHSNVDRLWTVWKSIPGGRRQDHTDPDFLDAEFVFYDENANLVKVKARDALDSSKLGVSYEQVEADRLWMNFSPQAATTGPAACSNTSSCSSNVTELGPATKNKESVEIIGKRLVTLVQRPGAPSQEMIKGKGLKKAEELREVLVLREVEVERGRFVQLVVFINLPDADDNTEMSGAEYVGTFNSMPMPSGSSRHLHNPDVRLEIGDNIKRIPGLQEADEVVITVVVKSSGSDSVEAVVKIRGIEIVWE